ncbi:hypothetical protein DV451_005142 [Geotrichum candidum]|uniref:TLC domain-containing protein n=1 Tax=Geotrichum candidum TaxID=1173061 RepID=A0A9P5KNG0_GEOCN|nr:hypothetical protein DV451_005142 [Geotrichum candidum]KAF5105218.1 hypothetical protein DV453_005026 [Geotrichum candidum]
MSEQKSKRRGSTVGVIGLGDNAAPSLSTMPINPSQERESRRRIRALSGTTEALIERTSDGSASSSGISPATTKLRASSTKSKTTAVKHKKQPQQLSFLQMVWLWYREISYRNSWFNPLILLIFFALMYLGLDALGVKSNPLEPFFTLSYRIEPAAPGDPVYYGKGKKDFLFVFMAMLFFTFFREFWMQVILRPLAIKVGIQKKGKISRFMEQTYSIVYYGMSGPFGLYIMYHTPIWYFNTTAFYAEFPHREHIAIFKFFYLMQAAFWAQQSVVLSLMLEKPRKDFYELVFHHIVTMALIFLSYRFHFTWIGLAVYVTMDISDFFLAISKTLNYLDSVLTGPFFLGFMGVWIYTRHYLNLCILYSILTEFRTVGPYDLNWETQQYKCWISQIITFALLMALQLVNAYWLFLIVRIAFRFLFSGVQKDDRSDDEEEEELEIEDDSTSSESSK